MRSVCHCIQRCMAIVRATANAELRAPASDGAGRAVVKHAGKKAPGKHVDHKHAAKKHAAKKHAAKKQAGRSEGTGSVHSISDARDRMEDDGAELSMAYHHLQRAGAVISLLEAESGGDLRALLEHGIDLYRSAAGADPAKRKSVQCASGLLRAAEHLGMAGLYSARREHRVEVEAPTLAAVEHCVETLDQRLDHVDTPKVRRGHRLLEMARTLLRQAEANEDDKHLRYELVMAADGICSALEAGL